MNSGGAAITKVGGTSSPNPAFKTTNFIIDTDNQVTILNAKKMRVWVNIMLVSMISL